MLYFLLKTHKHYHTYIHKHAYIHTLKRIQYTYLDGSVLVVTGTSPHTTIVSDEGSIHKSLVLIHTRGALHGDLLRGGQDGVQNPRHGVGDHPDQCVVAL